MKEVFDLATRKFSEAAVNSDMTAELQSLSTQLYYMLVMMLSDQALEMSRNSSEGSGAEVLRKLLQEYEPRVGIRYGAMFQSLSKRRFGEHGETDLARKSMQCMSTLIKNGKAVAAAHGQTNAVAREAKASPRREARAKRMMKTGQQV